jgi:hypothetical protein
MKFLETFMIEPKVSRALGATKVYTSATIDAILSARVNNRYRVQANKNPPSQARTVRFQSWHIVRRDNQNNQTLKRQPIVFFVIKKYPLSLLPVFCLLFRCFGSFTCEETNVGY